MQLKVIRTLCVLLTVYSVCRTGSTSVCVSASKVGPHVCTDTMASDINGQAEVPRCRWPIGCNTLGRRACPYQETAASCRKANIKVQAERWMMRVLTIRPEHKMLAQVLDYCL